jgi:hypothetical protein
MPPPPEPPVADSAVTHTSGHDEVPVFGVERARALLRTGISYPDSIRRLTALGLTPEAATATVDHAVRLTLEERAEEETDLLEDTDRHRRRHRTLSGVAAIACILSAYWFFGPYTGLKTAALVLSAAAIIWFPSSQDTYTSPYSNALPSPGVVMRWGGWFVLAAVVFVLVWAAVTVDHFPRNGMIRSKWGIL